MKSLLFATALLLSIPAHAGIAIRCTAQVTGHTGSGQKLVFNDTVQAQLTSASQGVIKFYSEFQGRKSLLGRGSVKAVAKFPEPYDGTVPAGYVIFSGADLEDDGAISLAVPRAVLSRANPQFAGYFQTVQTDNEAGKPVILVLDMDCASR